MPSKLTSHPLRNRHPFHGKRMNLMSAQRLQRDIMNDAMRLPFVSVSLRAAKPCSYFCTAGHVESPYKSSVQRSNNYHADARGRNCCGATQAGSQCPDFRRTSRFCPWKRAKPGAAKYQHVPSASWRSNFRRPNDIKPDMRRGPPSGRHNGSGEPEEEAFRTLCDKSCHRTLDIEADTKLNSLIADI